MAQFSKTIEANPFQVSDSEKAAIAAGDSVFTAQGIQIKKDGDQYFGLVRINHGIEKVQEGDYIIEEVSVPVAIVPKDVFEAIYTPVSAPAAPAPVSEPVSNEPAVPASEPVASEAVSTSSEAVSGEPTASVSEPAPASEPVAPASEPSSEPQA